MSVNTMEKIPAGDHPAFFRNLWNSLTKPSDLLTNDEKKKARVLSAVLTVFAPLAVWAIFVSPVTNYLASGTFTPPTPGLLFSLLLIPIGYVLSRTRYYTMGARITIAIPLVAVLLPLITTAGFTTTVPLFFLSLSVVFAGLLLSSRDTLVIGIVITIIILFIPRSPLADDSVVATQSLAAVSFVAITTIITVLVGRIREDNLRELETREQELSRSLKQTDEAREAAERSRERAERSDQVKSAFLASMSHELRTPLNAIINFTEFVAAGDTGPVNEQQHELLTEVIGSGKHLLNLINDVLDMSKIEAGSLNLFIEDDVNLKGILESSLSTVRSLVKDGVQLESDIQADLPKIRGDRQRILQILLNILSNACKFTEKGSIKLKAAQTKDEILISIADTGSGIAPADQEVVFQAFKQTQTGLRQGGGTGLGMPIAKSLAEAHGGRLWLESEVGKGSTFYVAVPVKSSILKPSI